MKYTIGLLMLLAVYAPATCMNYQGKLIHEGRRNPVEINEDVLRLIAQDIKELGRAFFVMISDFKNIGCADPTATPQPQATQVATSSVTHAGYQVQLPPPRMSLPQRILPPAQQPEPEEESEYSYYKYYSNEESEQKIDENESGPDLGSDFVIIEKSNQD
jgi:hypothetical protein